MFAANFSHSVQVICSKSTEIPLVFTQNTCQPIQFSCVQHIHILSFQMFRRGRSVDKLTISFSIISVYITRTLVLAFLLSGIGTYHKYWVGIGTCWHGSVDIQRRIIEYNVLCPMIYKKSEIVVSSSSFTSDGWNLIKPLCWRRCGGRDIFIYFSFTWE